MSIRSAAVFVAALGWTIAVPLGAQVPETTRDTVVYKIDEIRVQAVRPVTTIGGASAIEISLDSLILGAATTVEAVLRDVPGVHVRRNSRGESEISVRGSESRQVAVLVDGVPLSLGWDGRTDLSVLPATAVSGLSVVRGLSSVLHGPNVLGGVVEMSVAGGNDFPATPSYSVSVGHTTPGGYAASATADVPLESGSGLWLLRVGAGFSDSPGVPLADGITEPVPTEDHLRLNTDVSDIDGFVAMRYRRDSGAWLSFAGSTFSAERGIAAELGSPAPRLWRYPVVRRTIVATSAGTGDRATPLGRGDLEATFGLDVGRTEIESYTARDYATVDATEDGDDRTITTRLLADHTLGARADLRAAFTFANITHTAIIDGVSADYQQKLISFGSETLWRLVERPGGALESLRLSVGAAFDRGSTPKTGGLPSAGTQDGWGLRAGMTALVNDGETLLHAGASRRGRFPALREAYSEALDRFAPNPDLRPEKLVAFEGGITTRLGEGGELQLVGFRHDLSDAIRRITLPDRRRQRVNSESLTSTGGEVLLSLSLGRADIGGDFTLQSVELSDPTSTAASRQPENLPETSGSGHLTLPLVAGLSAHVGARYTGSQFCLHLDTGEDVELDAGTTLNADLLGSWSMATAGSRPFSRIEAGISVDNVRDSTLYEQCGLPKPGRVFSFKVRLF